MNRLNVMISDKNIDQISSRYSITNLFGDYEKNKLEELELDFSNITFISRAAAHQLITEIKKIQKNGVKIIWTNVDAAIEEMLDVVKKSIETNNKSETYVERLSFSSEKELDDFLLTVN